MKKKICCMFGGKSTEYKVSLRSAENVLSNIDRELYDVVTIGITERGEWYLYSGDVKDIPTDNWMNTGKISKIIIDASEQGCIFAENPDGSRERIEIDIVFPVMHGVNCEDGRLQGMLSILGIPFVGCGTAASAITMDKTLTKLILSNYEIPQANAMSVTTRELERDEDGVIHRIEAMFEYPVFIKPSSSGSSVGASKAESREELVASLKEAAEYDNKILVEEYISGREIEIAALEDTDGTVILSRCGEIKPNSTFYDYETKYETDTAEYFIPARIHPETYERIKDYAELIFTVLGCSGLSRIDFFVRDFKGTEQVIFNEINSIPGFTSISMFPQLMQHHGFSYRELITRLVECAEQNQSRKVKENIN